MTKKRRSPLAAAYSVLAREPVYLGAFVTAAFAIVVQSPRGTALVIAGVAWVVRLLSAPKAAVAEAHKAGRDSMAADISSLAPPPD